MDEMDMELQEGGARDLGSPAPGDSIRVLLIEDNPGDARLIRLMLAKAELFELERVDRLGTGLERLANGAVDVVLVDLSLPDSEGFETFARLHERNPHVPIIVLSGLNDTKLAVNAVHEGAQDYLIKGEVDAQLLARAIRYAIERKRMSEQLHRYAEELRKKNAQLEADFNMAREIQQIFLPQQHPSFPLGAAAPESALKFFQCYLPAAAVGGDFFDIFAINNTTAGVFLCDVMGHGMRAALITAIMRGLVEELLPVAADAGKFLTEINRSLRAILRQTRDPFLATAFYAVVDLARGELRFSNAGHPSPFRVRPRTGVVERLNLHQPNHGPALGLFEKTVYPPCRCELASGDEIILYTDGIYEVNNPRGQEFGQERLSTAIERRTDFPVDQLFRQVVDEVRHFSGRREFEDDVCLLGVQVNRLSVPARGEGSATVRFVPGRIAGPASRPGNADSPEREAGAPLRRIG